MFSNKRNILMMKNFLCSSIPNLKGTIRINLFSNGSIIKRFSVHVNNSHSDPHTSEGNGHNNHHDEHHDDHHGHHEITGEVDLEKVYVPLSAEVKFSS